LENEALVKTVRFKNPAYIGDPINTVWIFNEMEVDEIIFLDITATHEDRGPNFRLIQEIASECFVPLSYGGGITNISEISKLFNIGIEKISLNSVCEKNIGLIPEAAKKFGSQSIIASVDVRKNFWGKHEVMFRSGQVKCKTSPEEWVKILEGEGAGELFVTSIDRDGTWDGYDIEILKSISESVNIPVIASGGAGRLEDFDKAVNYSGASAVAASSMFVYQKKGMGVLIKYPQQSEKQLSPGY
jgi:cyclase